MPARHTHDTVRDRDSALCAAAQPLASAQPALSSPAERAATYLSLACAVHCLVMPVAIGVMPLLGSSGVTDLGHTAEHAMTLLVVASALAGVIWGYRRHHDMRFIYATLGGLVAFLVGHAFEGSWYGIALAVTGALTLAASSFSSARVSHAHTHAEHCTH